MECVDLRLNWQIFLGPGNGIFDVEFSAKRRQPRKSVLLIRPRVVLCNGVLYHDEAIGMKLISPVVRLLLW